MDIDKRNQKIYNKIITTDKDKNFDKCNLIGKTIRNIKINKYLGLTNSYNRVYECNCINCNQKLILTTSMINDTRSSICNCQRKYNFKIEDPCIKPLYRRWYHMRQRCNNASDQKFSNYGGRNIKVCPEWDNIQTGFLNFYNWAINNGWSPYKSLSIDRIDVNKGYSPDNCRWADNKLQAANRTDNHYIQYNQWIFPVNIWAEIIGLNYNTLFCRIYKYGWSIEKSLFTNTKINSDNIKIPYEYEIYNKYQEWIDNKKIQPFELEMNSGHPVIHDFKPENGGNNIEIPSS